MEQCRVCGRDIVAGKKTCQYCKSQTFNRFKDNTISVAKKAVKVSIETSDTIVSKASKEISHVNSTMKKKKLENQEKKLSKLEKNINKLKDKIE